jgi:hypothetical protein
MVGTRAKLTNASLNSGGAGKVEIQLVAQTGWVNRKYRLAMRLESDQDRKQIGCLVPWLRKYLSALFVLSQIIQRTVDIIFFIYALMPSLQEIN